MVFLFVFINCFVPRDHWEITFVMLRFSLLCKTFHPLFLMGNIKLEKDTCQFYIVFQVLKGLLIKSFCLVLHELLHQKISFLATFFNFTKHCLKKDFCHKFSFFNRFNQTPHSLKVKICVRKKFCWHSLTFCKASLPDFVSAQIFHQKKIIELFSFS